MKQDIRKSLHTNEEMESENDNSNIKYKLKNKLINFPFLCRYREAK